MKLDPQLAKTCHGAPAARRIAANIAKLPQLFAEILRVSQKTYC